MRTVEDVMHMHPHIHAELARQRQAELIELARLSRAQRLTRPNEHILRLATLARLLRRLTPLTNKETCHEPVRHLAS